MKYKLKLKTKIKNKSFRICAWCEKILGVSYNSSGNQNTHGICEECKQKQLEVLQDENKNAEKS